MTSEQPHRVVPPSRRRDKPILSCNLCRRRKLKCDRQQPCRTCVDRGLSLSCVYTRNVAPAHEAKPHNVHDRIDQLEKLLTSIMGAKGAQQAADSASHDSGSPLAGYGLYPNASSSECGTDAEITSTPEVVKLEKDATKYQNSGHWSSILDGIAELREQLDQIPMGPQPQNPVLPEIEGPDLLFGRQQNVSRNDILAAIPPRAEADQLLSIYFASMEMAPNIIHRPTFQREYERFWGRPDEAPAMWLALLFSVFALSCRFQWVMDSYGNRVYQLADVSLRTVRMDFYREKVAQCLVLANYTKCPPYTIEAFLQYFVTEYFRSQDSQFGTWMLVGMIVQIAFRMGYHREPSRFSNISVFKAEMRRKIWTMIVQLDLMSSSQVGLPRMIQESSHDVMQPRNLKDEDLNENMVELPPSRPLTEFTPMHHALQRNKLLQIFAQIMDLTNSSTQPAYREITDLDAVLQCVYQELPYFDITDFDMDNPDNSKRRLFLELNFLKANLMLHRPYHLLGRTDPRYERSRMICLDAALEILDLQKVLDTETRPGGRMWSSSWQLWSVSWRMSSMVNHDFLLATTVLSLDLDKDISDPMSTLNNSTEPRIRMKSGQPSRLEIIEALQKNYSIWIKTSDTSREAQRIAAAIRHVLRKAGTHIDASSPQSPQTDQDTPPVQYEFQWDAAQPDFPSFDFASADPISFNLENPHFQPPLFTENNFPDTSGFNWRGLEIGDFPMTSDPNSQNSYL